ncbi:Polyribonucleotide nucleotidyltransferase [Alloiococcus otitis]|uniref:Polyribonucleotide nucleotidyltransferase n=1 Tax=Alloiococcus otitis ATCC 51267 TaxID=883081 RepID=K9EE64_9LACT|nr:polyribonucleotide nucleotidyltransferase [Alloiococcus otitis]EKU94181.1 polyribonucleotide nucleotidyltransferase [Alloiococcus otitis ATCC 51267]SUU81186.1 Polyribonucleotide nucleotidyltransferase [Alloiococcus otitis]
MTKKVFTKEFAGRTLQVEVGQLAKQANAAVLIRYDNTAVLTAVVNGDEPSTMPFFPLMVNYEEKMYSVGKIPGGFIKREGRPSEHATLTARLIDRPIRPLFPEGFQYEVQIYNTVMSVDPDCSPEMAAMFGSSLALSISSLPFNGPIAGVNVGRVDGKLIINPTEEEDAASDIHLTVAGTKEAINMVESGADQVSEEDMLEALLFGHQAIQDLCLFQEEIIAEIGQEKMDYDLVLPDPELVAEVKDQFNDQMTQAIQTKDKQERGAKIEAVKEAILAYYEEKYQDQDEEFLADLASDVKEIADDLEKEEVRRLITEEKVRPDGRKVDEIRDLESEVGLFARVHGSGLFTRGQTQALSALTLGPLNEHQVIDGLSSEEEKRFIHHYNFPSYSVGETGRPKSPGRREIGHGALGERALEPIIPSQENFPYTIRLVAEVLESNGSSSQASICAGSLALMDGGVPIKAPVGGIAMGLVMNSPEEYTVLTDIQGLEDHLGDMDFKVAGTRQGITALQMDIKIEGITEAILKEALASAKEARLSVLDNMEKAIAQPRPELSPYAPKIKSIKIKPDQIKIVIGKGGDQINEIIDETGVKIDIDDDGNVSVYGQDQAMIDRAIEIIEELTEEVEVGKIYKGKVVRIEKFGAFVEIIKGTDGLVHISELADGFVRNVEDVVKLGEELEVLVTEIDSKGRVNLSRKQALHKLEKES